MPEVEGSIEDPAVLRVAFEGAQALFWLTPSNLQPGFLEWAKETAERAASVAAESGISRVVVLSSAGAHSGPGVGPVSSLGPVESAFETKIPHVIALRPGFFMENYLRDLGSIASMGKIFSPADADRAGLPEFAAQLYVEMYRALNDGRMVPAEPRDAASTTRTELASFAQRVLRPQLSA